VGIECDARTGVGSTAGPGPSEFSVTYAEQLGGRPEILGAASRVCAEMYSGWLPENRPPDSESDLVGGQSHVDVRFFRDKSEPANHKIVLCVGDALSVRLDMEDFIESFMAVVPRWMWKNWA